MTKKQDKTFTKILGILSRMRMGKEYSFLTRMGYRIAIKEMQKKIISLKERTK